MPEYQINMRSLGLKALKILGWISLALVVLFFTMVLTIRSPWGQGIIVEKATQLLSRKIDSKLSIDRLFITFTGNAFLEGLYLEDQKGDTLVYSKNLEVSIALIPLLKGETLQINLIDWSGLTAHISREESSDRYNFDFILDTFNTPPDTTINTNNSPAPQIEIGSINFSRFNLSFSDELTGLYAHVNLGKLHLQMNELDIQTMRYDIEEFFLADSEVIYRQTKQSPSTTNEGTENTAITLPYILIENLSINRVNFNYESIPDQMYALGEIGNLELELPQLDLTNQKIILDKFLLAKTTVDLSIYPTGPMQTDSISKSVPTTFEWPDWEVRGQDISLSNNTISFTSDSSIVQPAVFNPSFIAAENLGFEIKELALKKQQATLELFNLRFNERSGFELKNLAFKGQMNNKSLIFSRLKMITKGNELEGGVTLSYPTINTLFNQPASLFIKTNLNMPDIDLSESFYFSPELRENPTIKKISTKALDTHIQVAGSMKRVDIQDFNLRWGDATSIRLSGMATELTNTEELVLRDVKYNVQSSSDDLNALMDLSESGLSIPKTVSLCGVVSGNFRQIQTDNLLNTSDGSIHLAGKYQYQESTSFEAELDVDSLQIGKILQNDQLKAITFGMKVSGNGSSLSSLNGSLTSEFKSLKFGDYDFSNLSMDGSLNNGEGEIELSFEDENLNLEMNTAIDLDAVEPEVKVVLDLKGINLKAIGITNTDIRSQLQLVANLKGNSENFTASASLTDGVVVFDRENYPIGTFDAQAYVQPDSTHFSVSSDLIDINLASNVSPGDFVKSISFQFKEYLNPKAQRDSIPGDVRLNVKVAIKQNALLNKVLIPDLDNYGSITGSFNFVEQQDTLIALLKVPHLEYGGSILDNLQFEINGDSEKLEFLAGWESFTSGPIDIKETNLVGLLKNEKLSFDFNALNDSDSLIYLSSEVRMKGDTIIYHLIPENVIFNNLSWSIPDNNLIRMAKNHLAIENFSLTRNKQELSLKTLMDEAKSEGLNIGFSGFNLATITSYLNPDSTLASGSMEGQVTIVNIFGKQALIANLAINQLNIMETDLGTLTLQASSGSDENYNFNLSIKEGNADLDITGHYIPDEVAARMNLNLNINKLQTNIFEHLFNEEISEAKGYISGNLDISGLTSTPEYTGQLYFEGVSVFIKQLNTRYVLAQEELQIDNKGLYLTNFAIRDADNNKFRFDGEILTEDFSNPTFDLTIKSNDFQAINSRKEDNELFFGKVGLDADLTLKGDLNIPVIRGTAGIREDSKLTVVVPESQVDLVEKEGIVLFVNKKNPDEILTRNIEEKLSTAALKGLDVNIQMHIGKNSVFKIVIDERTGDNFEVSGVGDFIVGLEPNGRTTLSGIYNISGGHFEASLYNLVKRRFEIGPQSTITWSGDPLNAKLDISAIYNVKAAPAPIMATGVSSSSESAGNKYQQKIPFLVYLNIDGTLLEPEISFNLDIPEDQRGSLGGDVYSRVQQLNNQQEQLNKQVFSLLVLSRFFPASGSDGSSGGTAAIARDNVNSVLSGQLNNLSDKIVGNTGLELDFGLNSYTDYQGESPDNRTELNINARKRLFNDRLIVQVGSELDIEGSGTNTEEGTPMIGNVSLEYLITENGRYRFQGFRKNEYESIIDGQLIVTGFALIFTKEFNNIFKHAAKEIEQQQKNE